MVHNVINILTKTMFFANIGAQRSVLAKASAEFFVGENMKVLIDGENLRHRLAEILHQHKKISDKNLYFMFDLYSFLQDALRFNSLDVIYYTTKIKQPDYKIPLNLQKLITSISESNRRWIADLTNQNINIIKAGYLSVRESSKCIHCGKKTLILQEKGVDVRIATDLVIESQNNPKKEIILGSSDSDLIPAIQASAQSGQKSIYFCYAGGLNRAVAAQAYKTITFDDALVLKHFKESK